MANLSDKQTKLKGKEYNLYLKKLMPPNSAVQLLRYSGRQTAFIAIGDLITEKFGVDWNDLRQEMRFSFARNDEQIKQDLAKATHISFNGQVFAFADGDFVFQPFFRDSTWERTGKFTGQTYGL